GTEQIALIPIKRLLQGAQANGDTAAHQGFHFKLEFSPDPQKHKTFWVNCPASSPTGGGGTTPTPGGGGSTPGGTTSTGSVSTPPVTTTPGRVKTSIGGVITTRRKHPTTRKHRRKLVHPARHRKVRR